MGCLTSNISPIILTVDSAIRYQTIEGWGATLSGLGIPLEEWIKEPTPEHYDKLEIKDPVPEELKTKIMDEPKGNLIPSLDIIQVSKYIICFSR